MNLINDADSKSWICQTKVNPKEFLDKNINELNLDKELKINGDTFLDTLKTELNLDEKSALKLCANCSISKLDTREDKEFYYYYRSRQFDLNKYEGLETLNARKNNLRLFKNQSMYRIQVLCRQKYRTNYIDFNLKENEIGKLETDRIVNNETLLTVQIFNPIGPLNYKEFRHNNFIMHEYQVLGSQELTKLKDIYQCVTDLISPVDCSQNPDISRSLNKAEDYTSSLFFINNCFYVDDRLAKNIDYSE